MVYSAPKLIAMNRAYMKSKIAASRQPIFSPDKKYHRRRLAISEKSATLENPLASTPKDVAAKVTPKIKVMFTKQLPTMLPKASSKCPFLTALMLVANSGVVVPKDTIVAPIIIAGSPMLTAILDADSTIKKAQTTTPNAPRNVRVIYFRSLRFSARDGAPASGVPLLESLYM